MRRTENETSSADRKSADAYDFDSKIRRSSSCCAIGKITKKAYVYLVCG
jgi:hypothetical protein